MDTSAIDFARNRFWPKNDPETFASALDAARQPALDLGLPASPSDISEQRWQFER
jgi:hypothetical protein